MTSLSNLHLFDRIVTGITPKGCADSPAGAEDADDQNLTGAAAETKTGNTEVLSSSSPPPPEDNSNILFAATNLNAHLPALHAVLPPRTVLLLFSGHSDPRSMSALAARRAEYHASQDQRHGNQSS